MQFLFSLECLDGATIVRYDLYRTLESAKRDLDKIAAEAGLPSVKGGYEWMPFSLATPKLFFRLIRIGVRE